jgi:hypothetical protein
VTVQYSDLLLTGLSAVQGPFIGSTGRPVQCLGPQITPTSLNFKCVTLGSTPPGAGGSGTIDSAADVQADQRRADKSQFLRGGAAESGREPRLGGLLRHSRR